MTVHKVYINQDDTATFLCPKCEKMKGVDVSQVKGVGQAVRMQCTCTCGHVHTIILERRKFFRKEVDLPGHYILDGEFEKRPMTVKDLSRSGLKFELAVERDLKADDILWVEFRLDNKQQTLIRREVVVKAVLGNGMAIGAEFVSRDPDNPFDKAYDMTIGQYTFSK